MTDGNEVANVFGGKVNAVSGAQFAEKLAESAADSPRGGDELYLNFSGKRGLYSLGQDARRVDNEEQWVVNIGSFMSGWIAWKGGKPVSQLMANVFTSPAIPEPDPESHGPFDHDKGEGWFKAKGFILKSLDSDEQALFKVNSKSGVSSISDLQKDIAERSMNGEPCWPIIRLDIEEFEAQGFKNFKPVFPVDDWLDDADMQKLAAGEYEPRQETKQVTNGKGRGGRKRL